MEKVKSVTFWNIDDDSAVEVKSPTASFTRDYNQDSVSLGALRSRQFAKDKLHNDVPSPGGTSPGIPSHTTINHVMAAAPKDSTEPVFARIVEVVFKSAAKGEPARRVLATFFVDRGVEGKGRGPRPWYEVEGCEGMSLQEIVESDPEFYKSWNLGDT